MATWTISKKLNVSPYAAPLVIQIKQYTSDFALKLQLYSTVGDLDIPAGATTKIRGTKRDGNGYELTGTRIGHTCTFSGTKEQMQQMTAAHGRCVFEVVVEHDGKELITANFYLEVQRAAMDAGTVTSESIIEEFADFQSKITAAQAAATAAQAQADRAEAAAESIDFGLDATPTQDSSNAVSSGGVYSALEDKADKDSTPETVTPEETDADFYLSDANGNVLLELADGHIKTKEFDSSDINTETDTTLSVQGKPADAKTVGDAISAVEESIPDVSGFADIKTPQETTADLFICDSQGNVIAELKDGHIRTKNFNSENVGTDTIGTTRDNTAQFYICDSNGNVIAEFNNGYINTKYFDSAEIKALVEKHDTPIWAGKKWACVGDSLTESYRRASKLYHDYVSEATGISAYNMGHSGCGYAMVGGYGKNFIGIAGEIPNDADVITVFGSGNDMSAGLDIGAITDTGNTTLCGCINQTLDVIFNNHPLVPLGVITPTPWMNTEPSDTNAGAAKMQNYVEAIVQICARRGIPCLDLYHCSNLHPSNATFRTLAYSKDDGEGTHPDEKGHAIIAPRFEAFVKTLLLV